MLSRIMFLRDSQQVLVVGLQYGGVDKNCMSLLYYLQLQG